MKIKTSDLTLLALNWAVAKCEGVTDWDSVDLVFRDDDFCWYEPSTNWAQGGPIIEREGINIGTIDALNGPYWEAHMPYGMSDDFADGPTPLIAAMRCYVISKLGDEVEIPENLK